MASTVFNGTNLLVKIADDGVSPATIGHSTSCSISFTNDMAAATTKDSSGFSEVIPAVRSAEISFDGLVDYTDGAGGMTGGGEIAHKLLTRQKCDFSFGTAATGDTVRGHLLSYSVVTTAGATGGDLSSGTVCASSSDITSSGYEQSYYNSMTINSADVDAGKVILFTFRADSVNSDYTINATVKYHLR